VAQKIVIKPRKEAHQDRSKATVEAILRAAARILVKSGYEPMTTNRVAEAAGVSVGSLYQYFPNKQAILYRLQVDEWEKTGERIDAILCDAGRPPTQRLRELIGTFFRSECEEAPLRLALDAAGPSYHDAPESRAGRRRSQRIVSGFVMVAAPRASLSQRRFAARLLFMTMTSLGKQLSELYPDGSDIDRWADGVSTMLSMYGQLTSRRTSQRRRAGRSAGRR
jgi:AcrR family transcriptional regulator